MAKTCWVVASDHLNVQYVSSSSDSTKRHQGRKRQFSHVEGNFATHVYLLGVPARTQLCDRFYITFQLSFAWKITARQWYAAHCPTSVSKLMLAEVNKVGMVLPSLKILGQSPQTVDQVTSLLIGALNKDHIFTVTCNLQDSAKQFHLSLSRTVPIRFHQIDPLITSLRSLLTCQCR